MRSIVIHDGPIHHSLALTSLVAGLYREYGFHPITWVTNERNAVFFRHIRGVDLLDINADVPNVIYDLCVNFGGSANALMKSHVIEAERYCGIYSGGIASDYPGNSPLTISLAHPFDGGHVFECLYERKETKQNIFQVMYQMAGLTWRGESYGFKYYPRSQEKDDVTGLAVSDPNVRHFIRDNLEVTERKLRHIPFKKNPIKQFDEVNKVENVITDDPYVMHVAVALRKHVEFLLYDPPTMRHEFFGKGFCHLVPDEIRGPVTANV